MNPIIVAAIITAASKAVPTIFQRLTRETPDQEERVKRVVSEHYNELKNLVTPVCVKLLKFAEDGTYHDLFQYREQLYPDMTFSNRTNEDRFNNEFEYRLRYLVATGFFFNAIGEYYITQLGAAFLAKARDERDFSDVLP
jgi:hypothetical protein